MSTDIQGKQKSKSTKDELHVELSRCRADPRECEVAFGNSRHLSLSHHPKDV